MNEQWARLNAAAGQNIGAQRFSAAAETLRQATAIRPDHADSWFNLGYVLRQTRAYREALDAYAEALRRGVAAPEAAHVNRAAILSEFLEQAGEAERELRAAIEKNPVFLPAWLNLGGLMEDQGDAQAAADAYRQALRVAPGNGRARSRLSAIHVHQGDIDTAIGDLESQLRRGSDSPDDQAELLFALGNALDAAEHYSDAFEAVRQANRIIEQLRPPQQRYNPIVQEKFVDDLVAAFPARPAPSTEVNDCRMLFICGMFRSGSTVIEQLLGRHPLVQVGGELELIPAIVHEHLLPYPACLGKTTAAELDRLRTQYLHTIDINYGTSGFVTDKRPDNFLHIGLIKMLFPGARIVHTKRAPLDTILSNYFLNFGPSINYSDRLEDIAHYLVQYRRLMRHWNEVFDADIIEIDYDELVRSPTSVMADSFAALGLPAVHEGNAPERPAPVIRTPSNWKARSVLHGRSSGRWRNYASELAPIRAAFAELED